MADEIDDDTVTTLLGITGSSHTDLQFLANISPAVSEPDSNWSIIGKMMHKPRIDWAKDYEVGSWLTSMDSSGAGRLFAVSNDGKLHSNRAGPWAVTDLRCPGLNGVWAASDQEVFAVGQSAVRVNVIGSVTNVVLGLPTQRLSAVHGTSRANVLAVGKNGMVLRFDGATWVELERVTNYNLLAVLCRSESEAYVAGAGGVLMRFNGVGFEHLAASSGMIVTGLAWYRHALHVATATDGVQVLGPRGLAPIKQLGLARLRTIGDLLFGIGNDLVVQYDGSGWWGGKLTF
jgi:hypothetical protein